LRGVRDYAAAAIWFARAAERDPTLPDVFLNYGFVLAELGRRDEAIAALQSAVVRAPGSASARHMLASLDGSNPDAPPIDYVRSLFDEYAERFERELTVDLGYRVPDILRRLIDAHKPGGRFARALDLGCGTGLSGAAVKDRVVEIVGIDVAKAMIAQARAKNIYSALFAMEIAAYLASNDARRKPFDLVIAADVFIYVGKLNGIFAALAERMGPRGLFAFSIEGAVGDSFVLTESGRYAHGVAYIERLASTYGFAVIAREAIQIRKAKDGHVTGFAFVLERTV
jgi:predicted TPR repeat methyltransferase